MGIDLIKALIKLVKRCWRRRKSEKDDEGGGEAPHSPEIDIEKSNHPLDSGVKIAKIKQNKTGLKSQNKKREFEKLKKIYLSRKRQRRSKIQFQMGKTLQTESKVQNEPEKS